MRTYLALFSHMYLHRWCGCNKKEECVCISHPKEHTPPTVLNSCCLNVQQYEIDIISAQKHPESPYDEMENIFLTLFNLNLCINPIICQFFAAGLYKNKHMKCRRYAEMKTSWLQISASRLQARNSGLKSEDTGPPCVYPDVKRSSFSMLVKAVSSATAAAESPSSLCAEEHSIQTG